MSSVALYKRLIGYVRPYRGQMAVAVVAMIIVAGTNSAVPMFVEPVMDQIFVNRRGEMLLPIALAVVALFTVKGIAGYLQGYLMGRIGHRIIADLRTRLVDAVLRQELRFFTQRPAGELVSRITFDTTQVQNAVTRALTGIFQHSLTIIGLTFVVFWQNWRMALVAVAVFPIAVYPLQKFGRMIRAYSKRGQEQMGVFNALLYELVAGIRVVKVFRSERTLASRIGEEVNRLFDTFRRTVRVEAASQPVMEWIGALGVAAVILLGGQMVIDETVSTGQFFSFMTAVFLLYDPVRRMNGTWQQIQQGVAAAERIFVLLDREPQVTAPGKPLPMVAVKEGLHFDHISFRYEQDTKNVLSDVEFRVPNGKTVALVGPSGAGKSTIADLVPRFYDPTEGTIRIDGEDIRQFDIGELRSRIAMVDQQTVLFDDTVRANIRMGRPDASDTDIEAASRAANAAGFIAQMPKGYDTMIGENGVTLSGGQRQRIAIARAILNDAPILILDEATSALDTESEREVQKALDQLMQGRTTLMIAHRLSTVREADEILVLESGSIVERGTHRSLLDQNGLYARLYEMQAGENDPDA